MASDSILIIRRSVRDKVRDPVLASKLEGPPTEVLLLIVTHLDIIARTHLALCSSTILKSIHVSGLLNFDKTTSENLLKDQLAAVVPIVPYTIGAPWMLCRKTGEPRYWVSKVPFAQCKCCNFATNALNGPQQEHLGYFQAASHMMQELKAHGALATAKLPMLLLKGYYCLYDEYQARLSHASFLTLKVQKLGTIKERIQLSVGKEEGGD